MTQSPPQILSERTIERIVEERNAQDQQWMTKGLKPSLWIKVLAEETGEVARAMLNIEGDTKKSDLILELIQVAAVAVAMIEDYWNMNQPNVLAMVTSRTAEYRTFPDQELFPQLLNWQGQVAIHSITAETMLLSHPVCCTAYADAAIRVAAIAGLMVDRIAQQ